MPRKRDCDTCGGTLYHSHRAAASEMCAAWLDSKRKRMRDDARAGRLAEWYADQLAAGRQIMLATNHHKGMAALKARLGDPRPEGMTLSLVRHDGPAAYVGYDRTGQHSGRAYKLSTDPNDYAWETMAQNHARKKEQV